MQATLHDGIRSLRQFLDTHGYDSTSLAEQLGSSWPPAPGQEQGMLDRSSEITITNILIRLFLLGLSVDAKTVAEFLPEALMKFCLYAELLQQNDEKIQARIVIVPIEDLLFASDAFRMLGTTDAAGFVLPASTHSANFLRYLTIRTPVPSALDLGCGCGIHALFAARHCERVVATDVSAAAIRYTRFNTILNDIHNVECLEGSLFEPVENQSFDLIISNPPFVVSPSDAFIYRDSSIELDEFCRVLTEQAPLYLREGGHLQMLCEWVEIDGQSWTDRVTAWVRGCDAWILHAAPVTPMRYVATRSNDISGESVDAGSTDEWLQYLEQRRVLFVHPAMMVLRKRAAANWLHIQNLPGGVVTDAGTAVLDGIAAVDFLESCDDESLLDAILGPAPQIAAESRNGDAELLLRLDNGLGVETQIDKPVAAFLQCFDNKAPVHDCIARFASMSDGTADEMTPELLSIVRVFVSRGFLQALDVG